MSAFQRYYSDHAHEVRERVKARQREAVRVLKGDEYEAKLGRPRILLYDVVPREPPAAVEGKRPRGRPPKITAGDETPSYGRVWYWNHREEVLQKRREAYRKRRASLNSRVQLLGAAETEAAAAATAATGETTDA